MTTTFYKATVVEEDGKLRLDKVPFAKGQPVQVFVSAVKISSADGTSLRGTVLKYEQPTAPVAREDWTALK